MSLVTSEPASVVTYVLLVRVVLVSLITGVSVSLVTWDVVPSDAWTDAVDSVEECGGDSRILDEAKEPSLHVGSDSDVLN